MASSLPVTSACTPPPAHAVNTPRKRTKVDTMVVHLFLQEGERMLSKRKGEKEKRM